MRRVVRKTILNLGVDRIYEDIAEVDKNYLDKTFFIDIIE